ncbi:MAG: hypothetical protein R6V53_00275 [Candidatus Woesearchaeota archaeon]
MKAKLIICLLMLVMAVQAVEPVMQEDFVVESKPVQNKVFMNETAVFELNITNNMEDDVDYLIYSGDVEWLLSTDPSEDRHKQVPAQSSEPVTLNIRPSVQFLPSLYGVSVKVKNLETQEVVTKEVLVQIRGRPDDLHGQYLPAIDAEVRMPEKVDPRKPLNISLRLSNKNRLDLDTVTIVFESNLINKEYETSLKELEDKTLHYSLNLDSMLSPQTDVLKTELITNVENETFEFKAPTFRYEIISYGEVDVVEDIDSSFLKKDVLVDIENTGNVPREYVYSFPHSFFKTIFISTNPDSEVKRVNGTLKHVWSGTLAKEESRQVQIVTNYRPVLYLAIAALLGVVLYYLLRSPIVLQKNAAVLGKAEGGVSELAIQIHVKNRSNKKFYDVEIKDKVPNLLSVKQEFDLGTLQPSKILKHDKRGTIIKWNVDELDSYEERILSYKVHAKLSILGDFSLPQTAVKFKKERIGRYNYAHSNVYRMRYDA